MGFSCGSSIFHYGRLSSNWAVLLSCKENKSNGNFGGSKEKKKAIYIPVCENSNARNGVEHKQTSDNAYTKRALRKAKAIEEDVVARRTMAANARRASRRTLSAILRMEAAKAGIVRKAAAKKSTVLYPKAILEALTDRIHNDQWHSALQVFGLLREQQWYKPNIEIYIKLLVMLGRCKKHKKAQAIFHMMLEEGCYVTVEVYTALLAVYGRSGLLDKAFAVLDEMKAIPYCQPNTFTYTVCIKSCVELGHFDHVDRLLAEMSVAGIRPNIVTYNTIVDGFGNSGMFEEMENVLLNMLESHDHKPDVWTMNSTVRAFGNRGQIEKMEKWYEKFYSIGIQPDVRTFNTMISSYGKQCLYEKMTTVMEKMQKFHFPWTIVTYNTVIDAYGKVGEIDKMEYFYNLMISEGVKPNSVTLCSLVWAYSKGGIFHKITRILRQMENSKIVSDTPFFNSVIDGYRRAGKLTEMEQVFQQMKKGGFQPDKITFTTMMKAYLSEGMLEKVEEMEKKMQRMLRTVCRQSFQ